MVTNQEHVHVKDIRLDPSTYGQKWIDIHELSASIESEEDMIGKLKAINLIINKIKCSKCRNHALDYLKNHKMKDYKDLKDEKGRLIGIFVYFIEFHNAVSKRINKELKKTLDKELYEQQKKIDDFSMETAFMMYYPKNENDVCSLTCGI